MLQSPAAIHGEWFSRLRTWTVGGVVLAILASQVFLPVELPLTELFENRDYPGSTHFFFDIGHQNALAFFDLPGLDIGPYAEVLGGLHHLAISVEPENWARIKARLDETRTQRADAEAQVEAIRAELKP